MFLSNDRGASWTAINSGIADLNITAIAIASDGSPIYAGTEGGGVFKSINGGLSWQPMSTGLDPHILSLVVQPGDEEVVFAGIDDGGGVYRSTDGGVTWEAFDDGLP